MVESIGPGRVTPLTPGKAVRKGKVDSESRGGQQNKNKKEKSGAEEQEKPPIGGNIDEMC